MLGGTLQGHLAPISSVDQVDLVMAELLKDSKAASATHNILGYRVYNDTTGKIEQVCCMPVPACLKHLHCCVTAHRRACLQKLHILQYLFSVDHAIPCRPL